MNGVWTEMIDVHDQAIFKVKRVWGRYSSPWKVNYQFLNTDSEKFNIGNLEMAWMEDFFEMTLTCNKIGEDNYVQTLTAEKLTPIKNETHFYRSGKNYSCEVERVTNTYTAKCHGFRRLSWVGLEDCNTPITDIEYTTTAQTSAYYWTYTKHPLIGEIIHYYLHSFSYHNLS